MSQQQQQQPKKELTPLQQAEIMEKQKGLETREKKLQALAKNLSWVKQKQVAQARERNRLVVTANELKRHKEDQTVYRAVGRMFIKRSLPDMVGEINEEEKKMMKELQKSEEDKKRIITAQEAEEVYMRQDYVEFTSYLEKHGFAVRGPQQ